MTAAERSHDVVEDDQLTDAEARASDLVALGAGLSVLLSLYEFYVRENNNRGIFVGHWAPTILAFAIYLRRRRRSQ